MSFLAILIIGCVWIYLSFMIIMTVSTPRTLNKKWLWSAAPGALFLLWALLPYNEREIVHSEDVMVQRHGNSALLIAQKGMIIYTKQMDIAPNENIKFKLVFYSEDAGYGRSYLSSQKFIVQE